MKKISLLLCFAAVLTSCIFVSCPSSLTPYYIQQQKLGTDTNISDPTQDWDDGSSVMPPLPAGKLNAFWILLPDGHIAEPKGDNAAQTQVAGKLGGNSESYTGYVFSTEKFTRWKFKSNFSSNVPEMKYDGQVDWLSNQYSGDDASADGHTISSMVYYRYCGKNPFGLYKGEKYPVYSKEGKPTGKKEALMTRFMFYRFTGKGGGVADLDNYIVAVDTYSKLVFAFAKPIKFVTLVGQQVPVQWAPIDKAEDALTHSDGRKYRFYEYDPSGYVTEDGVFHMTNAYKTNLAAGKYIPPSTEKSPYFGCGGTVSFEQPLTGTLTVKAKYVKNVSIPNESLWNPPEFSWDVRSRAYSGEEAPAWDSLEKNTSYRVIKKGESVNFTGSRDYNFTGANGPHVLEFDSEIIEVDNGPVDIFNPDDPVTKYEKPIIYLKYDTAAKAWKIAPDATNGVYTNAPVTFDTGFALSAGDTKDFIVTLPGGPKNGGDMQLCCELTWQTQ